MGNDDGIKGGNSDVSQIKSLKRLKIERERLKERNYRELYSELVLKHKGVLSSVAKEEAKDFEQEKIFLSTALKSERSAILAGFAVGLATFATVRFIPRIIIRRFGGEEKIQALKQADEDATKSIHGVIRQMIGILVEGSFAIWAGSRAYSSISDLSHDTYELIAELPLVAGRSVVADNLCKEWIDISHRQIPSTFWENVDAGTLRSPETWRAIQRFCDNCVKRDCYEKSLRKERHLADNEPVSLPTRVPNVISVDTAPFTKAEAKQLTDDKS